MNAPHVILEAATSADITAGGSGLTLRAGVATSPFGDCLIAETTRGICHLTFFEPDQREQAITAMRAAWPLAGMQWDDRHAGRRAAQIFTTGRAGNPSVRWKVWVRGTLFQVRVWQALLNVPIGTRVTYGQLAATVGHPAAARATGTALGNNPIAFLIPCHRVVRSTGDTGHYRWGCDRKRAILAWETCQSHSSPAQ